MGDRFQLSKWYLDCVTPDGNALIAYWAELRWRQLAFHYVSTLEVVDGRFEERASLRGGKPPRELAGRVEWRCDALDCDGAWEGPTQPSPARELHRVDDGRLVWRCIQPRASVSVSARGRRFEGAGYSEIVTLSIPPWALPIDELRWGRAHFPGRSVVWVDWTGKPSQRLVLVDGVEVQGVEVSDARIATPRTRLALGPSRTLRAGPVAGTSVGEVPGVRQALSQAGLLIDEHKWLSDATLEEEGVTLAGTAIHEVVKWR